MWSRFVMSQVKHNSYFLCGVALGLWVSLALIPLDEEAGCAGAPAAAGGGAAVPDDYEPAREERPLGPAGQAVARSVQRPRYYSTELGMRGNGTLPYVTAVANKPQITEFQDHCLVFTTLSFSLILCCPSCIIITIKFCSSGSLLSGVLSSEDALKSQVPALNQTMARLQPALKFFITASVMSAVPGLANVVGESILLNNIRILLLQL